MAQVSVGGFDFQLKYGLGKSPANFWEATNDDEVEGPVVKVSLQLGDGLQAEESGAKHGRAGGDLAMQQSPCVTQTGRGAQRDGRFPMSF